MKPFKFLLLITAAFSLSFSFSQNENQIPQLSLDSGSIDNQFEYVIQKSGKYQNFKVVKRTWLNKLKANTLDSILSLQTQLKNTKDIVLKQQQDIDKLTLDLQNTSNTLNTTKNEKNSMSLLGISMAKGAYNVLMWFLVLGLLAGLVFLFYQFKNSNVHTKQAKLALKELEEEYDNHRKTALEREQKVRRQLIDEVKKNKTKPQ